MEAAGLAFSVAQTLLAALSYPPLQQMFTMWGYQSELENLERTVSTVSAVLLDAQSVDEEKLSNYERNLIEKLKDAVYDADDLLDEFATLAKRQHQLCMEGNEKSLTKIKSNALPPTRGTRSKSMAILAYSSWSLYFLLLNRPQETKLSRLAKISKLPKHSIESWKKSAVRGLWLIQRDSLFSAYFKDPMIHDPVQVFQN
uniref:Disease resistance N-terminal domain-containing protein n=1 Tax=Opuntia streptacantha TaxID=393608 RepID=A0A7C8ZYP2_OPUST